MVLPFDHTHDLDLIDSMSKFEIALLEELGGWVVLVLVLVVGGGGGGWWLSLNERDVSRSFMTMTVTYG